MKADETSAEEDALASWLAACDDALASGNETPVLPATLDLPQTQPEANEYLACVHLLRRILGKAEAGVPAAGMTADMPGAGDQSPEQTPPANGDLPVFVANYEILGELGRGGMGVVYKARHIQLNRQVALKMILAGIHAGPQAQARFRIEAETAARLQHPHIVQIYEVGEADGKPFLSLEFVTGGTLADKLDGTPWPARPAAQMVESLARAMHVAHLAGIVHRDLKPANVLLTKEGLPKISDFGLAKQLDSDGGQTASGAILGTPSYMAPEQAGGQGKSVGPAADIYALGAILYELLTGRPPFKAATPLDTVLQVVSNEPVPPRQLQPKIPRDLETICLKCLEKETARRYASGLALGEDLGCFLRGEPVTARPVGALPRAWRWCRRNPKVASLAAAVALLLVTVAVVATLAAFRIAASRDDVQQARGNEEIERKKAQRQSATLALDRGLRFCEDGDVASGMLWLARSLEFAPADAADLQQAIRKNLTAWRQRLCVLNARFPHEGPVYAVAPSPDGKIILTGGRGWQLWDSASGLPLARAINGTVMAAAFSPDGKTFLTGASFWGKDKQWGEVQLWDTATRQPIGKPLPHQGIINSVAFSPDGQTIGTGIGFKDPDKGEARLWSLASSQRQGVSLPHPGTVYAVAFSPGGKSVLTGCRDRMARLWDVATGKLLGKPFPIRDRVTSVAFAPNGKLILTGTGDSYEGTPHGSGQHWDIATGNPVGPPLAHNLAVLGVAFGPGGKTVLTGSFDRTACLWEAAEGKMITAPLRHQAPVLAIALSPDGDTILTGSGQPDGLEGEARLWEIAGHKPLIPPLQHSNWVTCVAFSPDGKSVVTGSWDGTARLWETATGKQLASLLQHDSVLPSLGWSPKGLLSVAFSANGKFIITGDYSGRARLWEAATGKPIGQPFQCPAEVRGVAFSPDSKIALTACRQAKIIGLWEATSGRPIGHSIPHPGGYNPSFVFSPDGKTLLTPKEDNTAQMWELASGKPVGSPFRHRHLVSSAVFSPDGKVVLTACWDNKAHLWETASGKPSGISLQHQDRVAQAIFSPDGRNILTGSWDNTAQLWETATGKRLGPPLPHQSWVGRVAFSADGQTVLTREGYEGISRLWDVATSKPLGPAFLYPARAVAFSPDGQTILSAAFRQQVDLKVWPEQAAARLWAVPVPIEGTAERIVLWTQAITSMELDSSGAVRLLDMSTWQERRRRLEELGGPPKP